MTKVSRSTLTEDILEFLDISIDFDSGLISFFRHIYGAGRVFTSLLSDSILLACRSIPLLVLLVSLVEVLPLSIPVALVFLLRSILPSPILSTSNNFEAVRI